MDFGYTPHFAKQCYQLPVEPAKNAGVLAKNTSKKTPHIYIGCPVWANKSWVGVWYSQDCSSQHYLREYGQLFNCVEVNSTHYALPSETTLRNWGEQVGESFRFFPKLPQAISHDAFFNANCHDLIQQFCSHIITFDHKLGCCLLQLPARADIRYLPHLERFLDQFPDFIPLAVELRHPSWFAEPAFDVLSALLQQRQVGLVITDTAGARDILHMRLTTPTIFIRFVGNNLHETDYQRLDEWAYRLSDWCEQGIESIYFFLHVHTKQTPHPADLAAYFLQKFQQQSGINVQQIKRIKVPEQKPLF